MSNLREPAVWLPAVRAGTGADVFTERLARGLKKSGVRAEITWLPRRAEYAPWSVPVPTPPAWANVAHVNTWLHPRFIPASLPIVATVHHCVHDRAFRPYKSLAQALYHRLHIKRIEQRVLDHANVVVADSQYTADRTSAAFGATRISVIYPGIDVDDRFHYSNARAPHKPFRLLFVGTGSRRKGVNLLVPIMEHLGPEFELSVVGTTSIGELPVPLNIEIKGRLPTIDDLLAAYNASDALLFPSRLEGFGLVAAEAIACGLPVIATRGSSITEVVEDGITGILCPQDDVASFAAAARKLAGDPTLVAAISRAARESGKRRFAIHHTVDAYRRLYSSLC